ncbi:MAG: phosphomannomutase [Epsilonproteobacteria bacterium]|nr:phosphomannomutase [Campylobacterota bacterium]
MKITIEDATFDTDDIRQLYPAAIIPSGYGDELTQISLEWYDTKDNDEIIAKKYGIFIHLSDKSVHPFYYENRDALEDAMQILAKQLT